MIHKNVGNCLPFDTAQRLKRLDFNFQFSFQFKVARLFILVLEGWCFLEGFLCINAGAESL
jgi:hypothetical protein